MTRRVRAVGFASAAAVCAGLAAGVTGGSSQNSAEQFGELREVVVATRSLPARARLDDRFVAEALEIRRIPQSFVPPDALSVPEQAIGRFPAVPIPPGSYLLASQLDASRRAASPTESREELGPGRRPIEIAVDAAGVLADRPPGAGGRVDVVVTTEPGPGGGAGRTFVAAREVDLLDLTSAGDQTGVADVVPGPATDAWVATLALTRSQALRLIQAESFARSVRLIGR